MNRLLKMTKVAVTFLFILLSVSCERSIDPKDSDENEKTKAKTKSDDTAEVDKVEMVFDSPLFNEKIKSAHGYSNVYNPFRITLERPSKDDIVVSLNVIPKEKTGNAKFFDAVKKKAIDKTAIKSGHSFSDNIWLFVDANVGESVTLQATAEGSEDAQLVFPIAVVSIVLEKTGGSSAGLQIGCNGFRMRTDGGTGLASYGSLQVKVNLSVTQSDAVLYSDSLCTKPASDAELPSNGQINGLSYGTDWYFKVTTISTPVVIKAEADGFPPILELTIN